MRETLGIILLVLGLMFVAGPIGIGLGELLFWSIGDFMRRQDPWAIGAFAVAGGAVVGCIGLCMVKR